MTLPNRFWMPENPKGRPYVTQGPLAAAPYVECVRVDSLPGWQPIETAPKVPDADVFIMARDGRAHVCFYFTDGDCFVDDYGNEIDATHWMEVPSA